MRKRRTFKGVLLGFAVAFSLATLYFVSQLAYSIEEKYLLVSKDIQSNLPLIPISSEGLYLDFSNIDNFSVSLTKLLGYNNPYVLGLNQVYNVENEILLKEYSSEDGSLYIVTDEEGKIICCKFSTDDEVLKQGIKEVTTLNSNCSFVYKEVSDGFVLEA